MRALKIALLSRWYAEENRRAGGPPGSGPVQQLAEEVAKLGHEVVVLSQSMEVRGLERSQIGELEVWLSPREKRQPGFTALRDKLAKHTYGHRKVHSDAQDLGAFLSQRGPFDVLWAQTEEPDGLVAAIAAQKIPALPPVVLQIQALRCKYKGAVPYFVEQPALRLAFGAATRILANSELIRDSLAAYAGPSLPFQLLRDKTRVVFPNVSDELLKLAEQAPAAEPQPGRVLFFGALNEAKGGVSFLQAVMQTQAAQKGSTFAVIGRRTDSDQNFLRRWESALADARAELGEARLILCGKLTPAEIATEIRRASVVVLPSLFDPFSRALVETLILGRPVVTTDQVGAATIVKDHRCGVVVPPGNPAALARAIDEVLRPEAPYAAAAKQLALRLSHEFSPEAIARQIAQQLEEVASLPK